MSPAAHAHACTQMEVSAISAHGASTNLQHRSCTNGHGDRQRARPHAYVLPGCRFREFSDAFDVYICKACSYFVDEANPTIDFFFCSRCQSREGVRQVKLPFTFLVLMLELMGTGVLVKLDIEDDVITDVRADDPEAEADAGRGGDAVA